MPTRSSDAIPSFIHVEQRLQISPVHDSALHPSTSRRRYQTTTEIEKKNNNHRIGSQLGFSQANTFPRDTSVEQTTLFFNQFSISRDSHHPYATNKRRGRPATSRMRGKNGLVKSISSYSGYCRHHLNDSNNSTSVMEGGPFNKRTRLAHLKKYMQSRRLRLRQRLSQRQQQRQTNSLDASDMSLDEADVMDEDDNDPEDINGDGTNAAFALDQDQHSQYMWDLKEKLWERTRSATKSRSHFLMERQLYAGGRVDHVQRVVQRQRTEQEKRQHTARDQLEQKMMRAMARRNAYLEAAIENDPSRRFRRKSNAAAAAAAVAAMASNPEVVKRNTQTSTATTVVASTLKGSSMRQSSSSAMKTSVREGHEKGSAKNSATNMTQATKKHLTSMTSTMIAVDKTKARMTTDDMVIKEDNKNNVNNRDPAELDKLNISAQRKARERMVQQASREYMQAIGGSHERVLRLSFDELAKMLHTNKVLIQATVRLLKYSSQLVQMDAPADQRCRRVFTNPARVFLSMYMVLAHPGEIRSPEEPATASTDAAPELNNDDTFDSLVESSRALLEALQTWITATQKRDLGANHDANAAQDQTEDLPMAETSTTTDSSISIDEDSQTTKGSYDPSLLRGFDQAWTSYYNLFQAWKDKDAKRLLQTLLDHAQQIESLWRTVQSDPTTRAEWEPRIEEQRRDLRAKAEQLAGAEGAVRLDAIFTDFVNSTTAPEAVSLPIAASPQTPVAVSPQTPAMDSPPAVMDSPPTAMDSPPATMDSPPEAMDTPPAVAADSVTTDSPLAAAVSPPAMAVSPPAEVSLEAAVVSSAAEVTSEAKVIPEAAAAAVSPPAAAISPLAMAVSPPAEVSHEATVVSPAAEATPEAEVTLESMAVSPPAEVIPEAEVTLESIAVSPPAEVDSEAEVTLEAMAVCPPAEVTPESGVVLESMAVNPPVEVAPEAEVTLEAMAICPPEVTPEADVTLESMAVSLPVEVAPEAEVPLEAMGVSPPTEVTPEVAAASPAAAVAASPSEVASMLSEAPAPSQPEHDPSTATTTANSSINTEPVTTPSVKKRQRASSSSKRSKEGDSTSQSSMVESMDTAAGEITLDSAKETTSPVDQEQPKAKKPAKSRATNSSATAAAAKIEIAPGEVFSTIPPEFERPAKWSTLQMVHELALDANFKIEHKRPLFSAGEATSTASTNLGGMQSLEARIRAMATKAYFDKIREDAEQGNLGKWIPSLLTTIREQILDMVPPNSAIAVQVSEGFDVEFVQQQIDKKVYDIKAALDSVLKIMGELCAPIRDTAIRDIKEDLSQITEDPLDQDSDASSSSTTTNNSRKYTATSATPKDLVSVLQRILELLELMLMDLANFRLTMARPKLEKEAIPYEQNAFKESLSKNETSLDTTKTWLTETAKKVLQSSAAAISTTSSSTADDGEGSSNGVHRHIYYEILVHAILDLVFSSKHFDVSPDREQFPTTLALDRERMSRYQNEVQGLALVAVILNISLNVPPVLKEEEQGELKLTLLKLMESPQTSMETLAETVIESKEKALLSATRKSGSSSRASSPSAGSSSTEGLLLSQEQKSYIYNTISRAISFDSTLYKVLSDRLRKVLESVMLSAISPAAPQSSGIGRVGFMPDQASLKKMGLGALTLEIETLAGQIRFLTKYNAQVYRQWYDPMLNGILADLTSSSSSSSSI
ncbi:hypothetical protein BGX26_005873 [Mortierella sp. AD094]|nr:hypothetical protein BGX26_005873 [Mortierella sp. AD094]